MPVRPSDRDCGVQSPGSSAIADAFGATVSVPVGGRSLFLVVGRDRAPDDAVRSVGGSVVVRLPGDLRVLAIAPLSAYAGLRAHPGLAHAGPVAIDPARFAAFTRLVGLDEDHVPAARPP